MIRRAALPGLLLLALAPAAGLSETASGGFPKGESYIIQLTSSQAASGLGEYLVPPLLQAMNRTGLVYEGGPGAAFAATVEVESDPGAWYETGGEDVWLYTLDVTVGLSPASMDIEPEGRLAPAFSVTARLRTPNGDREDEWTCLIALASRELAARYRPEGQVLVNGARCLRKQ
jgi:hypothetical protein